MLYIHSSSILFWLGLPVQLQTRWIDWRGFVQLLLGIFLCCVLNPTGQEMETFDVLTKGWPILLAIVTLIIVLAKLDLRVAVLEEKVKSAFEIINKMKDRGG
jgi:hypothetical protein